MDKLVEYLKFLKGYAVFYDDYHFTIDEIEYDPLGSSCGQCKEKYPFLSIYGDLYTKTETRRYWGQFKTYCVFSCKCPDKKDIPSPSPPYYFQLNSEDYNSWEYLYLNFNMKTIKLKISLNDK